MFLRELVLLFINSFRKFLPTMDEWLEGCFESQTGQTRRDAYSSD
jgi:hypothetical protein